MQHAVRLVGQRVDRDQEWHLSVTSLLDPTVPYCLEGVQQQLQQTSPLVRHGGAPDCDQLESRLIELVIPQGLRPNPKRQHLITGVKDQLPPCLPALAGSPRVDTDALQPPWNCGCLR